MKKHSKVFKALTLLICLVVCVVGVKSDAFAYTTKTTTYTCPRTLCSNNLLISGPYGNTSETVDSNVPFFGGKTYLSIYQTYFDNVSDRYNTYHMYLIYCPKYKNSDTSIFRDTMILMFAKHGYTTVGYTQYNASQHYANQVCDHGTDFRGSNVYALSQTLCGENAMLDDNTLVELADKYQAQNGCGKEKAVLENHTWSYGAWYSSGDGYHTRTKTCTGCGYSAKESDNHTLSASDWVNSSSSEHKRTTTCSVCDYSKTENASHQFTYGKWTDNNNGTCTRTESCSLCGYKGSKTQNHSISRDQWEYYFTEVDTEYSYYDYHKRDTKCTNCGFSGMEFEPHTFTEFSSWSVYSEKKHERSKYCTVCNYTHIQRQNHTFLESDYIYEDNNDGTHTIKKPCAECGYIKTEIAEHNRVTGEWFKYGTENPYDEEYDHKEYHQRDNVCSDCGNVESEHAEHEWYWVTDSWIYVNDDRHSRTKRCRDCDFGWYYGDYHHYTNKDAVTYESIDEHQHTKFQPCDECDYIKETAENHKFGTAVYTQFSSSQHQVTQTCVCGEKYITYADHIDQNNDYYCDKCGYLMTRFSVTVPTTMVLTMGTDGEVYSPSEVVIVNNSTAAVSVSQADITSKNGWSIVPYSTNMASEKVDSKQIGFEMNGVQTVTDGSSDSFVYGNEWSIEKDTSSAVVYDAVVSATSSPIDEQVLEVVFIVDWKTNY